MTESGVDSIADMKIEKSTNAATADRLIAAHDGDVALLYIHAVRNGGVDAEKAARDLCRTLEEIRAAEEKLRRMGLLPLSCAATAAPEGKIAPEECLPDYKARDIVARSAVDAGFSAVLQEAGRVFGHALSSTDLKRLFGIYDYLALPADVIHLLLHHCAESCRGRRLSMRMVEKEAYSWVNREILTYEQAEEYIDFCRRRRESETKTAEAMGISGRSLTAGEKGYISSWHDMGMDDSAIAEAYERTVLSTGKLSWGYMNKILRSWHECGIHSLAEAEQRDPRRRGAKDAAGQSLGDERINIKELINKLGEI